MKQVPVPSLQAATNTSGCHIFLLYHIIQPNTHENRTQDLLKIGKILRVSIHLQKNTRDFGKQAVIFPCYFQLSQSLASAFSSYHKEKGVWHSLILYITQKSLLSPINSQILIINTYQSSWHFFTFA